MGFFYKRVYESIYTIYDLVHVLHIRKICHKFMIGHQSTSFIFWRAFTVRCISINYHKYLLNFF